MSLIAQLEQDADFKKLTYDEQVKLRAAAWSKDLAQEPDFMNLHPYLRMKLMEQLVMRRPRFEDPYFDQMASRFEQEMEKGVPGWRAKIGWTRFFTTYRMKSAITQLVMRDIYLPIRKMMYGEDPKENWEFYYGRDEQKLQTYIQTLTDKDARLGKMVGAANFWGNIGGYAMDVAMMYRMFGAGLPTKAASSMFETLAETAPGFWQTRFGQIFGRHIAQQLLPVFGAGAKDVLRELLLDFNDDWTINSTNFKQLALSFGMGAGRNLVISSIASMVLPLAVGGMRRMFGGFKDRMDIIRRLKTGDFDDLLKREAGGYTMSDRILNSAPEHIQDRVRTIRVMHEAGMNPEGFIPGSLKRAQFNAGEFYWSLAHEPLEGGYRMRSWAAPNEVLHLNTLDDVNMKLSEIMVDWLRGFGPEDIPANIHGLNAHLTNFPPFQKWAASFYVPTGKVRKGFVSLLERQYGLPEELEAAAVRGRTQGITPAIVHVKLTKNMLAELGAGKSIKLADEVDASIAVGEQANAYAYLRRPASFQDYLTAVSRAKQIKDSSAWNILRSYGYDAAFLDEAATKLKILSADNIKFLSAHVDPKTGRFIETIQEAVKAGTVKADPLMIRGVLKATAGISEVSKDSEAMSVILASALQGGKVDIGGVRTFSRLYLDRLSEGLVGAGAKRTLKNLEVAVDYGTTRAVPKVAMEERVVKVTVPQALETPDAERLFVRVLAERLQAIGSGGPLAKLAKLEAGLPERAVKLKARVQAKRAEVIGKGTTFANQYEEALAKLKVWSTRLGGEKAAQEMAAKIAPDLNARLIKTQKGWAFQTSKGVIGEYPSADAALDDAVRKAASSADMELNAAQAGFRLRFNPDGTATLTDPRGTFSPVTGASAAEVFEKVGVPIKIPNKYMPRSVFITGSGEVQFEFTGPVMVSRGVRQAYKTLDNFLASTYLGKKLVRSTSAGRIYKEIGRKYFVYDASIDHWFDADTPDEAVRILGKGVKDAGIRAQIAAEKGVKIIPEPGTTGYSVIADGKELYAKTDDELARILKDRPLPQDGPELIDIEGEVKAVINEQVDMPRKGDFEPVDLMGLQKAPDKLGMGTRAMYWIAPRNYWIPDAALKAGHPELARKYRELENAARLANREAGEYGTQIDRALSLPDKAGRLHLMAVERQRLLWRYMGAESDEAASVLAGEFKLTADELKSADQIRIILGRTPKEGLAARFLEDPHDFIFNYMSRLVKGVRRIPRAEMANLVNDQMELARKLLGTDKVTGQIAFWAKEQRLLELIDEFAEYEDHLQPLLHRYVHRGFLQNYMQPIWEDTVKYLNSSYATLPRELYNNMTLSMKQWLGIPPSVDTRVMQQFGSEMLAKLGLNAAGDATKRTSVMQLATSLYYTSTMGWRPLLAIRNLMQIYQSLGVRFGNYYVNQALRLAVDPKTSQLIYEHLQDLGAISSRLPLFADVPGANTIADKVLRNALSMYKNGDDWTRVVTYLTAKAQWEPALRAYRGKLINDAQFLERAGVNLIQPEVQETVKALVRKGAWDTALDKYAVQLIDETMFNYDPAARPRLFSTSMMGKAFGQFGTWNTNQIANIIRGFQYGTKAQKVAFAGRFLFNSAALYAMFKTLGVRANEFLPWAPLQFSGGPLYWLINYGVQALGPGYEGREARGKLARLVPLNLVDAIFKGESIDWSKWPIGFTPGYYQARAIQKFIELSQQGDYFHAGVALTTASIQPEEWPVSEEMFNYLSGQFQGMNVPTVKPPRF